MVQFEMLDENKDYGVVHGSSNFRYEQDGKFFDAQKRRVDASGNVIEAQEPLTRKVFPDGADTPKEKVVLSASVAQVQRNSQESPAERKKIVLPKRLAKD